MKKLVCFIISMAVLFSITGCRQDNIIKGEESSVIEGETYDVTMEVVPESVKSDSLTICAKNNTKLQINTGNEHVFSIEVLDNGKWYTIETEGWDVDADATIIEGETYFNLTWADRYGTLPKGHYRIVKDFFPWTENGSYGIKDRFYLTAEFDVG